MLSVLRVSTLGSLCSRVRLTTEHHLKRVLLWSVLFPFQLHQLYSESILYLCYRNFQFQLQLIASRLTKCCEYNIKYFPDSIFRVPQALYLSFIVCQSKLTMFHLLPFQLLSVLLIVRLQWFKIPIRDTLFHTCTWIQTKLRNSNVLHF